MTIRGKHFSQGTVNTKPETGTPWHVQGKQRPVWLEGSEQGVEAKGTAETVAGGVSRGPMWLGIVCRCDGFHGRP